MTRRDLARLAAAGLLTQQAAAADYGGALAGFEGKVEPAAFDPVAWTLGLHDQAPLRLTFRASAKPEAEHWQHQLRPKIAELLGGFPHLRTPLRPVLLETRDFPAYTRERFVFTSRPGVMVLAYLLKPRQPVANATVLCIPGHGRGVDDIVGIDENGRDRTNKAGYQHDFAIQVAEHGLNALALEPMAFGCRRDAVTRKVGAGNSACQPSAGAALLLGQTMIGWRVWDVMRAIDWIETRPDLDAGRVGCMGISGGGTCTLFSAALEPRIKAAMVSGYLNTFRASIMSLSHCIDNYVPGILNWAEAYDVGGLIAPRPLFVESAIEDPIFPIEASKYSFSRVKQVYTALGAPEKAAQAVIEGDHHFDGKAGIPFLVKHLA